MQQEKILQPFGTRFATKARMSSSLSNVDSPDRAETPSAQPTLVSLVAAKAGREAVWVLIASIFLVVEALVFVTELPSSKIFHRREAAKHAPHSVR